MRDDIDFSRRSRSGSVMAAFGSGAVRLALLFSTAGIALAMFLAPQSDRLSRAVFANVTFPTELDQTTTGSSGFTGNYTIRRSVLQSSPDSVCLIRSTGSRHGDC